MKAKKLSRKEAQDINHLVNMLIEAACGCNHDGKGFLGHQRACMVHHLRSEIRTAMKLVKQS